LDPATSAGAGLPAGGADVPTARRAPARRPAAGPVGELPSAPGAGVYLQDVCRVPGGAGLPGRAVPRHRLPDAGALGRPGQALPARAGGAAARGGPGLGAARAPGGRALDGLVPGGGGGRTGGAVSWTGSVRPARWGLCLWMTILVIPTAPGGQAANCHTP